MGKTLVDRLNEIPMFQDDISVSSILSSTAVDLFHPENHL